MQKIIVNSPKYGKKEVLVDDSDYDSLMKYSWHIVKSPNTFYAKSYSERGKSPFYLHRLIMQVTDRKRQVDHRDHNGLNNQRNNLRIGNSEQNNRNKTAHLKSTSKYLGVCLYYPYYYYINSKGLKTKYYYENAKWRASITINKKTKFIGDFNDEIEAAKAYDKIAKELFGNWANLNFK